MSVARTIFLSPFEAYASKIDRVTQLREKRDKQETRFLERTLEKREKETKEETRLEDFRILGSGKRLSLREELEREREREGLRAGRAGGPWTGCP